MKEAVLSVKRMIIILMILLLSLLVSLSVFTEANGEWILTQYDAGGSVGMFYSLVNQANGMLILIDGGWTSNAEQVKSVIEANGGAVNYWILTHYHEDHCGAFNALWPEYKEKIENVYVTPLTWNDFEPYCREWDTPETFKLFLEQTKDAKNIVPLHRGDKLDIDSLDINIYNAWDDIILLHSTDVANNCSLVFRIQYGNTSVLFLGDMVAEGLADFLLETYGADILHADYIQAGHHGWGRYPMSFYQTLNPKEIFLDATDDLLTSEEYKNAHGILVRWCQENGIPMHSFKTAPYNVTLK